MTLKSNWEKKDEIVSLNNATIKKMLHIALPKRILLSHEIISSGCANLNIKLNFQDQTDPLILRIYLRDKEAAYKEQKLCALISNNIPVPKTIYVGDLDEYRYAIITYIEGKTLRDIILGESSENTDEAMYEAGKYLARFQNYKFSDAGFFDTDLNIKKKLTQNGYTDFLYESLKRPIVSHQLGKDIIKHIKKIVEKYHTYFPDASEHSLVHADYDPANILVDKQNGVWKITAILDWEFSFSGSYLPDVANMLRYAHQLPVSYAQSFLKGIEDAGIVLPENWQVTVHLLNLLSLLDCLVRSSLERPKQCADIKALIHFILEELENIS